MSPRLSAQWWIRCSGRPGSDQLSGVDELVSVVAVAVATTPATDPPARADEPATTVDRLAPHPPSHRAPHARLMHTSAQLTTVVEADVLNHQDYSKPRASNRTPTRSVRPTRCGHEAAVGRLRCGRTPIGCSASMIWVSRGYTMAGPNHREMKRRSAKPSRAGSPGSTSIE